MRREHKGKAYLGAALAAAALAVSPGVFAQQGQSQVTVGLDQGQNLSGPEQVQRAAKQIEAMKTSLRDGFSSLERARADKDIVKLNCVNEKLASMKGLLKISEQADVSLQEAVARRDKDTANHEYTKIAIAAQKVESLSIESKGCAGEATHYTGDTRTEVTAEGNVPPPLVPPGMESVGAGFDGRGPGGPGWAADPAAAPAGGAPGGGQAAGGAPAGSAWSDPNEGTPSPTGGGDGGGTSTGSGGDGDEGGVDPDLIDPGASVGSATE